MSNLQAAIKVADQIVTRIFDQRQFTSGEINYISQELGDKANLEENFDKILKINENVCMISDLDINGLCNTTDSAARKISDEVAELQDRTERILKIEDLHRRKEEELLRDMRAERERAKEECSVEISSKLQKLRETLTHEEEELRQKYSKFEENMRNN